MSSQVESPQPHAGVSRSVMLDGSQGRLARWGAFAAAVLALLFACRDTAEGLVTIWMRSETYAHAFVVPPLTAWMVWRLRDRLVQLPVRSSPWMLLPLLAVAMVWFVGVAVVANAVAQVAFAVMLILLVPLLFGLAVARALLFPLAFLLFAVPLGDSLTPVLMQWTADFTIAALRLSGVPVFREGLQFVIPSGSWSVVEACSGIRYLMASFMVGSLFAYLNYRSPRRRLVFVAVSILLPVVANWLRAYMIVMLGHLSNNAIATGADHLLYGWVFFGVVIVAMFMVGARWAEEPAPDVLPADGASMRRPAESPAWLPWVLAALAAGVFSATAGLARTGSGAASEAGAPSLQLPEHLSSGWQASPEAIAAWDPVFIGPSARASRTYRSGAVRVGVHLAYYAQQAPERKLVNSRNVLVHSRNPDWNLLSRGEALSSAAGDAAATPWRAARLLASNASADGRRQELRAWQLYWVDGHLTHSDIAAKSLGLWQRVRGRPDAGAALILYADATAKADAEAQLAKFWRENSRELAAVLESADRSLRRQP